MHETICRCLGEQSNQGIFTTDTDLTITNWNRWMEEHSGRPASEMVGQHLMAAYPDLASRGIDHTYRAALSGQSAVLSHRFHRYVLPMPPSLQEAEAAALPHMLQSARISPLTEEERVVGTLTLIEDVTERVVRDSELEAHIARLWKSEKALQITRDALAARVSELERRNREITLLGEMGNLLQVSLDMREACGVVNQFLQRIFPEEPGTLFLLNPSRNLLEPVAAWGDASSAECVFRPDDCFSLRRGRVHLVETPDQGLLCRQLKPPLPHAYLCIPLTAQGEILGLLHVENREAGAGFPDGTRQLAVTVAENIALGLSNLKLRETLRNQSIRDPLTGLFNRRYMEESIEREISRAERGHFSLGVIMLDIDHFKDFNDSHGHPAGDALLRELGAFLLAGVRGGDIACRYGGEEFMLILPEAPATAVLQRAEDIREKAKALVIKHQGQVLGPVSLSLGVALFPDHGETAEKLIGKADKALYAAKTHGRDRVETA